MNTINIQIASKEDLEEILHLQKQAFITEAELHGNWDIEPLKQTYESILSDFTTHTFLKAIYNNTIIGSVKFRIQEDRVWVGKLIVDTSHRRKGLGKKLLIEVEKLNPGAKEFQLFTAASSTHNIRLYERAGYQICREYEDQAQNGIIMVEMIKKMWNKTVIIIGVGKGFGVSLVRKFIKEGYNVVLMGRDPNKLRLPTELAHINFVRIDVTSVKSIQKAFEQAVKIAQSIELVIYNVVKRSTNRPTQLKWETVADDMKINVGGAINVANEALALFRKQNRGMILFTGGGNGINPSLTSSSMSICKAGLRNYVLNLANELKDEKNISIGLITITKPVLINTSYSPEYIADSFFQLYISQTETEGII